MARFIKLTLMTGDPAWINSDHICCMRKNGIFKSGTDLWLDGVDADFPINYVEETVEEILKLMAEAGDM